jgi:hypothetical protein
MTIKIKSCFLYRFYNSYVKTVAFLQLLCNCLKVELCRVAGVYRFPGSYGRLSLSCDIILSCMVRRVVFNIYHPICSKYKTRYDK